MSGADASGSAWAPRPRRVGAGRRGADVPARPATGSATRVTRRTDHAMTAIVVFVIACAVIADRAVVGVSTGGRGALSLLIFAAPAIAVGAVARYGTSRTLSFLRSPVFLVGVVPYLALTLLLPFLGVMFNRYPERTLISVTEASTAFSFLVLGAAASTAPMRRWRPWLVLAIVIQLAYAAGQMAYLGRAPGWELFGPLHAWDLSLQGLYGAFVQARGTGLYFNPNELGLWAGAAAILAWVVVTPRWRPAVVILAVGTLALSQSRGASVALVAAAAAGAVVAIIGGRTSASGAARTAVSLGLVGVVVLIVVVAVQPSQGLVDRFGALVAVWTQGPRADANLAGRLDYWSSVIDLNSVYPWGTWGPPEMLLGTAVDSTWFRVFAQGSVPYAGALVLLLVSPFALHASKFGSALIMMTVLIAVAGLTQTPLNYPIAFLFWALLGAALQDSVTERDPDLVTVPPARPSRRSAMPMAPPARRRRARPVNRPPIGSIPD